MWFLPHILYISKIFNSFSLKGDKFEIVGEIETQNKHFCIVSQDFGIKNLFLSRPLALRLDCVCVLKRNERNGFVIPTNFLSPRHCEPTKDTEPALQKDTNERRMKKIRSYERIKEITICVLSKR